MTTEEKVIAGITAVGIAALVFHKPTRNAVGLSDSKRKRRNREVNANQQIKRIIKKHQNTHFDVFGSPEYMVEEYGSKNPKITVVNEKTSPKNYNRNYPTNKVLMANGKYLSSPVIVSQSRLISYMNKKNRKLKR
jgi:hypothetical protein